MYLRNGEKVRGADIYDGMIVWLGAQPVRFMIPARIKEEICTTIKFYEEEHNENC